MLDRGLTSARRRDRVRAVGYRYGGDVVRRTWRFVCGVGAIGPDSTDGRAFGGFGAGSLICFPTAAITNPHAITIGSHTLIAAHAALSAGWAPGQPGLASDALRIGDRCLIGRGSSIVAHRSIVIGDDVWTGPDVYITDMNHGYEDLTTPISEQFQAESPVVIGDGSWLGAGAVVLPGVTIGRHVVVGAGAVVTDDVADRTVVVGVPARPVRRNDGTGWLPVGAGS